jgi:hypothetical protein
VTAAPASRPPEPRRRIGRRQWPLAAAAVALVAIGAVAGMLVLRSPVQSNGPAARSAFLGEVDLAGYCRSRGFLNVVLDGSTAYDWRCVGANTPKQSFSVIEACRWQYARPEALARYTDIHNPNSWQCWNDIVVLGRVDLDKYCLAHGYTRALLTGTTVDTYSCVSDQGRSAVIDEDSACRWAYGSRALVSSANSYFRPWEQWDCWG